MRISFFAEFFQGVKRGESDDFGSLRPHGTTPAERSSDVFRGVHIVLGRMKDVKEETDGWREKEQWK